MNPISAILIAWLIVLTVLIWRRRDMLLPRRVLAGRVVEVREGRYAGEAGFTPLVAYDEAAGRPRVIETSVYAPSRAWSVGDAVEVVVDRNGDADVYDRRLIRRFLAAAYLFGFTALFLSFAVAPPDDVAATAPAQQTAELSLRQ